MHGIGGEQDALCAGVLQGAGGLGEEAAGLLPIAIFLAVGNVLEFDAVQQQGRAVVATFDLVDAAVDVQVIGGGAFGRHAADDAECVHAVFLSDGFQVACGQYGLPENTVRQR